MKTEQVRWTPSSGWNLPATLELGATAQLVLAFGGTDALADEARYREIRSCYPAAHVLLSSTAGEISGTDVLDDSIALTAIRFERTELQARSATIESLAASYETGRTIASSFPGSGLVHLFVISDGQLVNGSELVRGLNEGLPAGVTVTGGLAGDGARFEHTLVGLNEQPAGGRIAAVGFYGSHLEVHYASIGGWDSFGPDRLITRSRDNVLYELDGQSALALYKKYLGDQAAGLPGTSLLFPLSLRAPGLDRPVVRTVLSIDESAQSMVFAGNMPEGTYTRLMKANFDKLVDGAAHAAALAGRPGGGPPPDLAVLISCVGRKLVLGQRIEEEVEAVHETFGDSTVLTGFYSYGEISPFAPAGRCELHNQTMTITTFTER